MSQRPRSFSDVGPHPFRPKYIYEPLASPKHIRVLTLLHYDPATFKVHARLNQVTLEQITNRYTALSYTWGPPVEDFAKSRAPPSLPESPHNIELNIVPKEAFETFRRIDDLAADPTCSILDLYTTNVCTIPVGHNLSDWFKSYLDGWPDKQIGQSKGSQPNMFEITVFWIDAICIDQDNKEEKACQIPLMGEIYSRASRVLGWLGPETMDLGCFGWWHGVVYRRLQEFLQKDKDSGMRVLREGRLTDAVFWKTTLGLEPPEGETWISCWTAYWAFYRSRKWFHRAWIVQEAVLARSLELQCGDGSANLEWLEMARLAYLIGEVGWLDVLNTLAVEMVPPQYTEQFSRGFGITDIHGLQRDGEQGWHILSHGWAQSWWAAVSAVRRRGCFLPEDKVYATLGILGQLVAGERVPFTVTATATAEEVYLQATKTLMLNSPQAPLTLLSFVEPEFRRNLHKLPSWVPDLTTAYFGVPIGAYDSSFRAGMRSDTPPSLPLITEEGELHVRGHRLDTIASISDYQAPLTVSLCTTALETIASLPTTYPHALDGQDRVAAVIHTMTCQEASNPLRGSIEQTARMVKGFRAWMLVGLGQVWVAAGLGPDDEDYDHLTVDEWREDQERVMHLLDTIGPHGLLPDIDELAAHAEEVMAARRGKGKWPVSITSPMSFKDQIQRVMVYRSLFMSVDGWLGVCRQTCVAGDEVWVLEGGAVPYVLRPVGGKREGVYRFMGECYVHGIMNGEVIKGLDWEDGEVVRIV